MRARAPHSSPGWWHERTDAHDAPARCLSGHHPLAACSDGASPLRCVQHPPGAQQVLQLCHLALGQRPRRGGTRGTAIDANELERGLYSGNIRAVLLLGADLLERVHHINQLVCALVVSGFKRRMDFYGMLWPNIDEPRGEAPRSDRT